MKYWCWMSQHFNNVIIDFSTIIIISLLLLELKLYYFYYYLLSNINYIINNIFISVIINFPTIDFANLLLFWFRSIFSSNIIIHINILHIIYYINLWMTFLWCCVCDAMSMSSKWIETWNLKWGVHTATTFSILLINWYYRALELEQTLRLHSVGEVIDTVGI